MSLYPKKHSGRASVEIERGSETHSVMPARPPMGRDNGGIQALDRAFLILDIIADAGGEAKLTEIAGIAGLNVSTCHTPMVPHSLSERSLPASGRFAAPCTELCGSPERSDSRGGAACYYAGHQSGE